MKVQIDQVNVRQQERMRIGRGKKVPVFSVLVISLGLLLGNVLAQEAGDAAGEAVTSLPGVAQKEVLRRQALLRKVQGMVQDADVEYREKNYANALGLYVTAFQSLSQAPASASFREGVFQRYQTAAVKYARQLVKEGHFESAEKLLVQETPRTSLKRCKTPWQ